MLDVSTSLTFRNPGDLVAGERLPQSLEQINLRAVTQFVRGLLLKLLIHQLHLFLESLALTIELCVLLQQGYFFFLLEGLPLFHEFLLALLVSVLLHTLQDFCFTLSRILKLLCNLISLGSYFLDFGFRLLVGFLLGGLLLFGDFLFCLLSDFRFSLLGFLEFLSSLIALSGDFFYFLTRFLFGLLLSLGPRLLQFLLRPFLALGLTLLCFLEFLGRLIALGSDFLDLLPSFLSRCFLSLLLLLFEVYLKLLFKMLPRCQFCLSKVSSLPLFLFTKFRLDFPELDSRKLSTAQRALLDVGFHFSLPTA